MIGEAGSQKTITYTLAFLAYPMKNRLLPLPYRLTDEVKTHMSKVIQSELANKPKVIFVAYENPMEFELEFLVSAQMKTAGSNAQLLQPNAYTVIIFKRSS
jgi:hypothetical protein